MQYLTSIRALCSWICHSVACLQIKSHLLLSASNLDLSSAAREVSSVWSARWVPTIFSDRTILLWLSRSRRNSLWSWITSSSCSMLAGGFLCVFWVPSATCSHFSRRHKSLSNCAQLRFVHKGHKSLPASL